VELLFDGREEAVQVDVEEGEAVGMEWGGHVDLRKIIYSLFVCRRVLSNQTSWRSPCRPIRQP
jgi:hypothetical protein